MRKGSKLLPFVMTNIFYGFSPSRLQFRLCRLLRDYSRGTIIYVLSLKE